MGLSNLGIFHTAIGIIAIVAAVISFLKHGKINLAEVSGKIYFYGTVIASLTALGLSKHGGFNAGIFFVIDLNPGCNCFFLYYKMGQHNKARYFGKLSAVPQFFIIYGSYGQRDANPSPGRENLWPKMPATL